MEIGVDLTTVASQGEADVICSFLRANGIACADRLASGPYVEGGGGYGGHREILVRQDDLDWARELLAQPST